MSDERLPCLRPGRQGRTGSAGPHAIAPLHPAGSCDPRTNTRGPPRLYLEPFGTGSGNSCRAIHQHWNEDVLEVTRRSLRLEEGLRLQREEAVFLEDRVYDCEARIQTLQDENEALRKEAHEGREIMHQIDAEVQLSRNRQVRNVPPLAVPLVLTYPRIRV